MALATVPTHMTFNASDLPGGSRNTKAIALGDVTGDGLNDLWVGASRVDTAVDDAGAVYLVPGQSSLAAYDGASISAVATITIVGAEQDDGLGTQLDGGVDFSGGSAPDLIIGVSNAGEFDLGAAYLFLDPVAGSYAVDVDAARSTALLSRNDYRYLTLPTSKKIK